jgi:hypothetical protein
VQHGVLPSQSLPEPRHAVVPQTPVDEQAPLQHGWRVVHGEPSGTHIPPPQTPFSQSKLQQSPSPRHFEPSSMQPQVPPMLQLPSQHEASEEQGWPCLLHMPPQVPVWGLQSLLQQVWSFEQGEPSGAHIGLPQTPAGPQSALQQSFGVLHGAPSGWHLVTVQMPSAQRFEQHWSGVLQALPSGPHVVPPHVPF